MSGRLGELLVRENLISLQQLQKAQDEQRKTGGRIGSLLVRSGAIAEHDLTTPLQAVRRPGDLPQGLRHRRGGPQARPEEVAEKHQVIPVNRAGPTLIVAMSDPSNIFAIDDIKFLTGYNIEVGGRLRARRSARRSSATTRRAQTRRDDGEFDDERRRSSSRRGDDIDVVDLEKSAEEAPVVKLVNLILLDAIKKGASDIHIEPYEKDFRVRFRIDGVLYEVMKPPLMKLKNAITSRLKIMAELDIAERRLPQDGRIKLKIGKRQGDGLPRLRLPTLFGEKIVMRLLDKSNLSST